MGSIKSIRLSNMKLVVRSQRNWSVIREVGKRTNEIRESWASVSNALWSEYEKRQRRMGINEPAPTIEYMIQLMKEGACVDPARFLSRTKEPYFQLEEVQARK